MSRPSLGSSASPSARTGPLARRRGLLLAAAALASLLVAEVAVRVLDLPPRPLEALPLGRYRLSEDPVLRFEYRPSYRGTTNSAGFRERELPVEKPAGTVRIAVLGDSLTAGNGVRDDEALFTRILERLLNEGRPERRIEVPNFGVGGYPTLQEVETLRTKALAYRPDHVVLVICLNDFLLGSDGGLHEELLEERSRLLPDDGGSLGGFLLRRSRLAFFA